MKKIEDGLVIDVAGLYDNRVTLRVENKVIGHGQLVIINDRYGVKITDIAEGAEDIEDDIQNPQQGPIAPTIETGTSEEAPLQQEEAAPPTQPTEGDDEEFDYSDFELEDEDI